MPRAAVLVLVAAAVPALATPLPEEPDFVKAQRVYGLWHDSHGDASFRLAGSELRVRMSGLPRDEIEYLPTSDKAPKFLRDVTGDFTLTVRVTLPALPDDDLGDKQYVAAGLTAVDSGGNRVGIRRVEKRMGNSRYALSFAYHNATQRGGGGQSGGMAGAGGPTYLRLARTGPTMATSWSADGAGWKDYGQKVAAGWAESVKVGLVCENTTGGPVTITFDKYALAPEKK